MTDAEMETNVEEIDYAASAEQAYEDRADFDKLEPVEVEIDPNVRSVVSVRFNRGELSSIETASRAAGVPLSTFIRNAALQASANSDSMNAIELRDAIDAMRKTIEVLNDYIPGAKSGTSTRPAKKEEVEPGSTSKVNSEEFTPQGYTSSIRREPNIAVPEPGNYRDPNGPIRLGARRRLAVDLLPFDHDVDRDADNELLRSEGVNE
jgi:hypothetical protein